MAGELDAGAPLASEALGLARGTGAPMLIAATLVALAGTLADRDPPRARSLLVESLQLRATLGFENPSEHTQGALVAARIGDWPLVLELTSRGIGHLQWSGNRPYLAGVLNLIACAIAASDAEAAAWLQGAARRLAPASASGVQTAHRPPPAESPSGGTSFLTEIRHRTTAALSHTLGEERLRELRAQGAASDEDHAVAHALDAIARAREDKGVAPP